VETLQCGNDTRLGGWVRYTNPTNIQLPPIGVGEDEAIMDCSKGGVDKIEF
jgi:hypothetical protein